MLFTITMTPYSESSVLFSSFHTPIFIEDHMLPVAMTPGPGIADIVECKFFSYSVFPANYYYTSSGYPVFPSLTKLSSLVLKLAFPGLRKSGPSKTSITFVSSGLILLACPTTLVQLPS